MAANQLADEGKELILADDAKQYYHRPQGDLAVDRISEIRVGGMLWRRVEGDPGPGQWTVHGFGLIQLGSPPMGLDVRAYDDAHGEWRALNG